MPVVAYNVSGEYAMVKAAAAAGYLDERATVLETLTVDPPRRRRRRHHLPREGRRPMAVRDGLTDPSTGDAEAAQPQARRGDPAGGARQTPAQPDAGALPDRAAPVRARRRAGGDLRGRGRWRASSTCSTSASSARSRRSSTRARSATARCSSPPRSTRRTRTAPRASSTRTPASRTTTCATTSSTCGSRSRPSPTRSSGCEGTLDALARGGRRRVGPPAADAQAVQDPHGPRDGGRRPRTSREPPSPPSRSSSSRSRTTTSTSP